MVHDLYQETILDHSKRPRNYHSMADANREADGYNPLCGDKLKLYLRVEGDIVKDASFIGAGCAISTSSASLMTESIKGKTREEALKLLEKFHELLTTDVSVNSDLGKLVVFCGVVVLIPFMRRVRADATRGRRSESAERDPGLPAAAE